MCMYACMCVCMYVRACVCVCVCVCVHVHARTRTQYVIEHTYGHQNQSVLNLKNAILHVIDMFSV